MITRLLDAGAAGRSTTEDIIPTMVVVALLIYFIPSFVAYKKQHIQKTSILLLNIFLGWTFIGWVVALVWANLKDRNNL